jgi:formylmethanofuran dehydrogenase subunit A
VTELANGTSITTAVAPGAKDAWAFGENVDSFSPYVVHYNGKRWSAVARRSRHGRERTVP